MAREKMVTRTFEVTTLEVLTVNVETAEVQKLELPVTSFTSMKKPLEYLKRVYETAEVKVVNFSPLHTEQILYSMTETEFLTHAHELPPRSEKSPDEYSEN